MKKRTPSKAADAPLTRRELSSARMLRDVFPDLAASSRTRARKGEAGKKPISIRLSPHVIAYFKAKGKGWQTRIDRALAAFVEAVE